MMIMDLDKEVEKRIRFFQTKYNCVIVLSDNNGETVMDVLYLGTGESDTDIKLGETNDNMYKILVSIGKYFIQKGGK